MSNNELDLVNTELTNLTEEEKKKASAIINTLDLTDSQTIIQYGVSAQTDLSNYSNLVLEQIRAKDTGEIGNVLSELMITVKDLDVDSVTGEDSFFSKLPLIGGFDKKIKRFVAQYQKMSVHIDSIVDELDKNKMMLLKDLTILDNVYEKNLEYLKNLDIFIYAGEQKINELTDTVIPNFKAHAESTGDPVDVQKANDLVQLTNRFEKRIHDLKLSRMIAVQTAPQIRLIQNNNQVLVEKIQSSILNTIPLWKNQVVIAISLHRQKSALKVQKEVTETTNEILLKNSELLKNNTIEAARESERGIVELETLKKVNQDLITTIEETIIIQEEGRANRAVAEKELITLEQELKSKLIST